MTSGGPGTRVVFVNRYFYPDESATSRMLSDLVFALADCGFAVSVVTSRQLYDDPYASLPPREVVSGVEVHRVETARQGRARLAGRALDYVSFHFAASARLLTLLAPGDVVVAKTDPPLICVAVSHVARLRGARLVNWLQDVFPEVAVALGMSGIPAWLRRLLQFARDRSLHRAAANVVLGERMRDHLLGLGIEQSRIRIVPNWADVRQITPLPTEQSATRRRLNLEERFVVGYSGNLGRAHEFETLLGAARLLREDARFAFLITGGGAKMAGLKQAVEAEGLRSFHFEPYQPADLLADSLCASDVHVVSLLPALEGFVFPSKLYGILAAGRPVVFIGDPDSEIARIVHQYDCGVAINVGDSGTLSSQLQALVDAPDRLASMGRSGHRLAISHYTTARALDDWQQVLRDVRAPGSILQPAP